jgi:Holliday junction DNA helicase RuvB
MFYMPDPNERLLSPQRTPEDQPDHALRPKRLADIVGQDKVRENLQILIDAAKKRGEAQDHVLFYGPPGLGKCITANSLVLTDQGLVEFSGLIPTDLSPGEYRPCQVQVYGRQGLEPASHIYADGRVPTVRLRTRSGFELEGTPNHPVLVATPNGPQWKPLSELSTVDFVAIARRTDVWGQAQAISFRPAYLNGKTRQAIADERVLAAHQALLSRLGRPPSAPELKFAYSGANRRNPTPQVAARRLGLPLSDGRKHPGARIVTAPGETLPLRPTGAFDVPSQLDADVAYLMGVLVGDGHFESGPNAPSFVITVSEPEIQAEIARICREKFNWTPKVKRYGEKAPRMRFGQNLGHLMIALGVKAVLAGEKVVPASVLAGPKDVARGFLQGLFDADGHAWRHEGYVDWSSKSEAMARLVQILLANFGVIAHRTKKIAKNGRTYWQLFIGGRDAALFYEQIGFRLSRKQKRVSALDELPRGANRSDVVPFAHVSLAALFNSCRPHSHAMHKMFDHVLRGDRLLSRSQVEKYLHLLPASVWSLPASETLRTLCDPGIYWDRVASVDSGESEVFDFCVPGTHSFVANGFFNHNTTLAHVCANEMGVNIKITAGPVIERAGDLAAILTNLRAGDILFIDEVHRLGRAVEEVLYPAMEDYALDIVIGKGPSARSIRLSLPKFTVIGATTRLALLTAPLRARFGAPFRLDFYELAAMQSIVGRAARMLTVSAESEGITEIARRARGTPRVALRLLKRVRDFAQVRAEGVITQDVACAALDLLEVDPVGLDEIDRRVLRAIIEKYNGGPVGLETIAAAISEEADTIMDVVEPYLLQKGFLDRTPRGRTATRAAYEHLGLTPPENGEQPKLI